MVAISCCSFSWAVCVSDQERLCAANGGMLRASERIFQKAAQKYSKIIMHLLALCVLLVKIYIHYFMDVFQ